MLGTLWILYLIGYIIFTLPFAGFTVAYIGGFVLPGILYAFWKIFEAMQAGGEFNVYYKVMGRWYFQCWALMVLPCSIVANFGPEWIWIASVTMLIVPTIFWFFMDWWMSFSMMIVDKATYDSYKRAGENIWASTNDLNWEENEQ